LPQGHDTSNKNTNEMGNTVDTITSDPELKTALENAKYAALTGRARTEQANALVDHVVALRLEADPAQPRGSYAGTSKQWRRGGWRGW
jgi:hypothetical protein